MRNEIWIKLNWKPLFLINIATPYSLYSLILSLSSTVTAKPDARTVGDYEKSKLRLSVLALAYGKQGDKKTRTAFLSSHSRLNLFLCFFFFSLFFSISPNSSSHIHEATIKICFVSHYGKTLAPRLLKSILSHYRGRMLPDETFASQKSPLLLRASNLHSPVSQSKNCRLRKYNTFVISALFLAVAFFSSSFSRQCLILPRMRSSKWPRFGKFDSRCHFNRPHSCAPTAAVIAIAPRAFQATLKNFKPQTVSRVFFLILVLSGVYSPYPRDGLSPAQPTSRCLSAGAFARSQKSLTWLRKPSSWAW